jgi:hypothetical protein
MLSHHVLNKLSAIVGNCDILQERSERAEMPDPQCLKRLAVIREIAMELAEEIKDRMSEDDARTRANLLAQIDVGLKHENH